jgi:outer membrane protein assembly factor BamB
LKAWPAGGPQQVWKAGGLGGGYSTPSVAGGRIYGMGWRGEEEVVWCLDASNARGLWMKPVAQAYRRIGRQAHAGASCTPTVEGDRLYALGVGGDLVCLKAADGSPVWSKNLVRDFGGSVPSWGYSESPLVDGNVVVVTPGGSAATLVALNKMSGEVAWRARVPEGDRAQYSSIIAADVNGQRHYVQFLSGGVVGVEAATGRYLWRYNSPANRTANCSTPIYFMNHVFAASGYGVGGGLARLVPAAEGIQAQEVWFTRYMKSHHGGVVLVDGHFYGFDESNLTCLDARTGQVTWADRSVGKGSVTFADGHLYARSERGPIALVEANPRQYVEKGRFDQPERSYEAAWAHPVVAGGKLYIRDQEVLFCYDVKAR